MIPLAQFLLVAALLAALTSASVALPWALFAAAVAVQVAKG